MSLALGSLLVKNYLKYSSLFVVGVLALFGLLSLLIPLDYLDDYQEYRESKIERDLVYISTALKMYYLDSGQYPTTEQGLQALVAKPSLDPVPKRYRGDGYLPDLPKRLNGNNYNYVFVQIKDESQPLLYVENSDDSVFRGMWVKMPNK